MNEHAVVIVGAGPTGLMLAGELALAGIDVAIVERRASQDLAGARAGGLHARTLEIFDQRGIAERFLSEGKTAQVAGFSMIPLDISDFPTRHNHGLALWQVHIERILARWVSERVVPVYRGQEVTDVAQDDSGVDVRLSNGASVRAQYLVGCDGGRSRIRKAAGIDFPGCEATTSNLIAEVELAQVPDTWGIRRDTVGIHSLSRQEDSHLVRVLVTEQHPGNTAEPTLHDLSVAMIAAFGSDYGVHNPAWLSRFTDATRQAAEYRKGRVLLAGDAAHVHPPDGGQGLQLGIQDAVNLGWKLAQVVKATSPDKLLDTYHAERFPVTTRALRSTMASVALRRADERTQALRSEMTEMLALDEPRKRMAGMLSGFDVRYDMPGPGQPHPLLGRRMPDLELLTTGGRVRTYTLLHDARPVLLNLRALPGLDVTPWVGRVRLRSAEYSGSWVLPIVGEVTAPGAVLIRPDGHVAWVGESTPHGLVDALTTWFGPGTG